MTEKFKIEICNFAATVSTIGRIAELKKFETLKSLQTVYFTSDSHEIKELDTRVTQSYQLSAKGKQFINFHGKK